jgi:hypothetical protein
VIARLTAEPFATAPAVAANATIAAAREGRGARAFSFEVLVPDDAGEAWVREQLLPKLVYLCESRGAPLPACAGVFVSFFVGAELRCVDASVVIARACALLQTTPAALVQAHGTGEVRHPVRLPGGEA